MVLPIRGSLEEHHGLLARDLPQPLERFSLTEQLVAVCLLDAPPVVRGMPEPAPELIGSCRLSGSLVERQVRL